MFDELRPFVFRGDGRPRVAVTREVDEIQFAIDAIEINRLRATWRVTGERQPALSHKGINQAGLADVASSQKSHLGQPVGGELPGTIGTLNEFRFQFYYTGGGINASGVISIIQDWRMRAGGRLGARFRTGAGPGYFQCGSRDCLRFARGDS